MSKIPCLMGASRNSFFHDRKAILVVTARACTIADTYTGMCTRGALILFCLIQWAWSISIPAPVSVQDSSLLRWLLEIDDASSEIPAGDWTLAPVSNEDYSIILFKNGTEWRRYPSKIGEQVLESNPSLFDKSFSTRKEEQQSSLEMNRPYWFWMETESFDQLDGRWFQQTEGLDLGRSSVGSRGERWWIRDHWWMQASKIWGSTRFGVTFTSSTDYMNIQRELRKYYGESNYSDYSWRLSLTWKAFTYELESAPWVLPEYYWLEPSVDSLWAAAKQGEKKGTKGKVVRQFVGASDSSLALTGETNYVHHFEIRLWHLRYRMLLDGDTYSSTVHRMGIEDLDMSIGTWGAFALGCGGIWVPGFWFELGPAVSLGVPWFTQWNEFAWYPVRFEMMYENTTHFRISFSTRLHLGRGK